MTTKTRPDKRIVLKSKTKGADGKSRYQDLIAIWSAGDRPYAQIDRRVVGLVLESGETIRPSDFFVNLDNNEGRSTEPRRTPDVFNDFEG